MDTLAAPSVAAAAALAGSDAPRLSVSDLFNAQAVHATYERLVDVINAQAAAVETLTKRLASLETTSRHAVAAQRSALQQADVLAVELERLQETQTRADAARRSQQSRVDELVLVVSRDAKLLETTVDRMTRLERELDTTRAQLQQEMAPMDLVLRLQDAQDRVHDRVAAIDGRLDSKLDKSEMSRLDGVVATIQAFAPTATQLTTRVAHVETAHAQLKLTVDDEATRTNELEREISHIRSDLDGKVDRVVWQEYTETTLATTLGQLQRDTTATSSVVNELVHRGVSLETSYRTLSSKLTSVSAAMASELASFRIQTTSELKTKLARSEIDTTLKDIQHELSCKAWRKDTRALRDDLAQLTTHFDDVVHQVALSTRFVKWYATRGESFERNWNVVESQLERVARASAPHLREPFGDQVRYTN